MKDKEYIEDMTISDKLKYSYQLTREDVLSEEGLLLVQCMTRDGMTMDAIAKTIGVTVQALCRWKKANKKLNDAFLKGRQIVDYQVENALLRAALGYKTESVKTIMSVEPNKEGNRTVKVEKTITETGPSVTACLAWLNNRKPEQWRRNRDNVIEFEDKKAGITINIVKGAGTDEEEGETKETNIEL